MKFKKIFIQNPQKIAKTNFASLICQKSLKYRTNQLEKLVDKRVNFSSSPAIGAAQSKEAALYSTEGFVKLALNCCSTTETQTLSRGNNKALESPQSYSVEIVRAKFCQPLNATS